MSGIIGGAGSKSGVIGITELMISTEHSNTGTTDAFYEEGDWNPTCSNLSNRAGRYIKIGNLIMIWGWIYLTTGGAAGATISGLPFTAINAEDGETNAKGGGMSHYGPYLETGGSVTDMYQVLVDAGASTFRFYQGNTAKDLPLNNNITFHFSYRIVPGFGYPVS